MRIIKTILFLLFVVSIIGVIEINFFSGEYSLIADIPSAITKKISSNTNTEADTSRISDNTTSEPGDADTSANSIPKDAVKVTFINVIDGDTLYLYDGADYFKCRLIGIDTPESVAQEEYLKRTGKQNTEEGKTASQYAKEFFANYGGTGSEIYLLYDVQPKDKYDRDLCYVFLKDGRMWQDILLSEGLARTMTVAPNVAYAEHFREVQSVAQQNKKGFWSGDFWTDAD